MAELYIKTTGSALDTALVQAIDQGESGVEIENYPEGRIVRSGNVIIDNRRLPDEAMPEIYYQAHGFLFLHCGEGWGMTGLEAMATGLPLIVSHWSGTMEYAGPENAYLVRTRHERIPLLADVKPFGKYNMSHLIRVGGIRPMMKILLDRGLLHGDCLTVTGETIAESLEVARQLRAEARALGLNSGGVNAVLAARIAAQHSAPPPQPAR